MAKCAISGRKRMSGHNVSHANNKTKRWFHVNTHKKRFKRPDGTSVTLTLSARAIRLIDRLGLDAALAKLSKEQ